MVRLGLDIDFYNYMKSYIPLNKREYIKSLIEQNDFAEFKCEDIGEERIIFQRTYIGLRFTIVDEPEIYFDILNINCDGYLAISLFSRFEEDEEDEKEAKEAKEKEAKEAKEKEAEIKMKKKKEYNKQYYEKNKVELNKRAKAKRDLARQNVI